MKIRGERIGVAHAAVALALLLALAAAFAGTPDRSRNARVDVDSLARAIEHEDDHVTALELAEWIRDRRPGLRVVDIRTVGEFNAMHIPTAERIPLSELSKTPFRRDETIVLYSEGGAHAGQGWVFLRALGYSQVYFLRGGLREWLDEVMTPTVDFRASDSVKKQFVRISDLSRYFGGSPRVGVARSVESIIPIPVPRDSASLARAKSGSVWGRGC
jgi:rhodanese-related sulfurtransferase